MSGVGFVDRWLWWWWILVVGFMNLVAVVVARAVDFDYDSGLW